jgi:hypothetical protein
MSNYQFKTTNIKGKEYVEVNQRVIALRSLSEYKGFAIETELIDLNAESCVVRATIKNADGNVVAQGMAQEDKASSRINQTSYVENCETSAVGRALGFLGIGIETSIATADEVDMAIKKQDTQPKPQQQDTDSNAFTKAIEYIKNVEKPKRAQAFDAVLSKYGSTFSEKQVEALKKFV